MPRLAQTADPTWLARRVEEASINAWPAMSQLLFDGWLIRFAQGFTKRANSVTPLYPGLQDNGSEDCGDLPAKVRFCENLYARERLKTIFRITSITDQSPLDRHLAQRGYSQQDLTDVLCADLPPVDDTGRLQLLPLQTWLGVYASLTGLPAEAQAPHGTILRAIPLPSCYAIIGDPAQPLACGLAVLENDLLGLFDVVTHPAARRAGHGRDLVTGLLAWGRRQGARRAYLQMVADNRPAADLYAKLGFRPLYRYWYRVSG